MTQNSNTPKQPSVQELMRLAASPAGQQLINLMRQQGGSELEKAVTQASAGDYTQAKRLIDKMMADPQAIKLLNELGG